MNSGEDAATFTRCPFCEAILPPGSHIGHGEAVVLALDQDQLFSLEVALNIAEARLAPGPDLDVVLALLSHIGREARS